MMQGAGRNDVGIREIRIYTTVDDSHAYVQTTSDEAADDIRSISFLRLHYVRCTPLHFELWEC